MVSRNETSSNDKSSSRDDLVVTSHDRHGELEQPQQQHCHYSSQNLIVRLFWIVSVLFSYVVLSSILECNSRSNSKTFRAAGKVRERNFSRQFQMPYDNVNAKESDRVLCQGKEKLVSILRAAGVNVAANDSSVCASLPTWKEVEELYGSEPRILGLDTCQRYRDMIQQAQQVKRQDNVTVYPMPRVAGLQNCGTTAFADTLQHNLVVDPTIHSDSPRAYNVPWRKHTPIQFKDFVTSDSYDWQEDKELVLPIVIARDPYRWMASMCEMNYNVNWVFSNRHCPNLVAYPEQNMESAPPENVPVVFALNEPTLKVDVQYPSLAHMWSTFNRDYLEYDAPRLMIRYEDTLFHGEKVFEAIQDCVGGMPSRYISFQPYVWNAKEGSADLVGALTKNGRQQGRYSEMIAEDIDFASQHLDPELMELLHYVNPTQIPADSYAAEDLRNREN